MIPVWIECSTFTLSITWETLSEVDTWNVYVPAGSCTSNESFSPAEASVYKVQYDITYLHSHVISLHSVWRTSACSASSCRATRERVIKLALQLSLLIHASIHLKRTRGLRRWCSVSIGSVVHRIWLALRLFVSRKQNAKGNNIRKSPKM